MMENDNFMPSAPIPISVLWYNDNVSLKKSELYSLEKGSVNKEMKNVLFKHLELEL